MTFWFSTANKRQSMFLLDHKLHDNLPLAMGMARAENGYLLVRYSTIEGWDALPIPLYRPPSSCADSGVSTQTGTSLDVGKHSHSSGAQCDGDQTNGNSAENDQRAMSAVSISTISVLAISTKIFKASPLGSHAVRLYSGNFHAGYQLPYLGIADIASVIFIMFQSIKPVSYDPLQCVSGLEAYCRKRKVMLLRHSVSTPHILILLGIA